MGASTGPVTPGTQRGLFEIEAAVCQEEAMVFPKTTLSRNPPRIVDLAVLVAVSALPMAGARPPSIAAGLAVLVLALGFLLWWLPWLGGSGKWADLFILPAFMMLTFVYLFLSIGTFLCDPEAAVAVVGAQLIALVYVAFRW
jgi:hypothetical protein